MSDETKAKDLKKKLETLISERRPHEDEWQELVDYIIPNESDFTRMRSVGTERTDRLIDSIGSHAMEFAASGLFSRATNPESKWFHFKTSDPELNELEEVQLYLEEVRDRVQEVISFQLAPHMFLNYRLLLVFGNGNLYIEPDDDDIIIGRVFPMRDIFIEEDFSGKVNMVFRRFILTAQQAMEHFSKKGDSVSNELKERIRGNNPEAKLGFVHVVRKNTKFTPNKKTSKPWESIWFEFDTGHINRRGGFDEMPYIIPRLDLVAGEKYGRGPGKTALPDIRTVNKMMELLLDAGNMAVRPPLDVPEEAYSTPLTMTPAALNWNQDEQGRKATPITSFQGDISINFSLMEEKKAAIRQIFFNDQLQLINGPRMTATEVLERVQQSMLLMGPWHGRLEREFLRPMIDRVFAIMQREDHLPEPPDILSEQELRIEYDSPLALAQKQADVAAIDDAVSFAANFAQITPEILDNIDMDTAYRRRVKFKGLSTDLLVPLDERDALREQRAQAAAAAAQAKAAQGLLEGAQGVAQLPGGEEIVRDQLAQAVEG